MQKPPCSRHARIFQSLLNKKQSPPGPALPEAHCYWWCLPASSNCYSAKWYAGLMLPLPHNAVWHGCQYLMGNAGLNTHKSPSSQSTTVCFLIDISWHSRLCTRRPCLSGTPVLLSASPPERAPSRPTVVHHDSAGNFPGTNVIPHILCRMSGFPQALKGLYWLSSRRERAEMTTGVAGPLIGKVKEVPPRHKWMRRLEQRQAAGPGALQLPVRQGTVSERFRRAETPQAWGIQIAFIQRSGSQPWLVSRLLIQCINITYLFYWLTTDLLIKLLNIMYWFLFF